MATSDGIFGDNPLKRRLSLSLQASKLYYLRIYDNMQLQKAATFQVKDEVCKSEMVAVTEMVVQHVFANCKSNFPDRCDDVPRFCQIRKITHQQK